MRSPSIRCLKHFLQILLLHLSVRQPLPPFLIPASRENYYWFRAFKPGFGARRIKSK